MSFRSGCVAAIGGVLLGALSVTAAAEALFARVAGESVTRAEYDVAVSMAARQRFYHGNVDEKRRKELRLQVAGELADRILLRQEAMRRGLKVESAHIDREVGQELGRYRVDELSAERRRHLQQMVREQVAERLLRERLERQVKELPPPAQTDVRAYYEANKDKFTTPPQQRLSLILLKVAPSAPVEAWRAAQQEGQRLRRKLMAGGDFAELATLHSGDGSAERGGELGFVHRGMLAPEAQVVVDALKVGEVSEPLNLLQGVALFKLEERKPEVLNPFDRVRERATGLLQRERAEQAWRALLRSLRAKAQVEFYDKEITTEMIWSDAPQAKQ